MYKKKRNRSFSKMFYLGATLIFGPIIILTLSIIYGSFFMSTDSAKSKSKKDSSEVKSKTVIVYDTVKVYKTIKKKKKKPETTNSETENNKPTKKDSI